MAKKKEIQRTYMQMPLPKSSRARKTVRLKFGGLCEVREFDTGLISAEENVSSEFFPYVSTAPGLKRAMPPVESYEEIAPPNTYLHSCTPLALFGFDNVLLTMYVDAKKQMDNGYTTKNVIYRLSYDPSNTGRYGLHMYGCADKNLSDSEIAEYLNARSAVVFNYTDGADAVTSTIKKLLLFYPASTSLDYGNKIVVEKLYLPTDRYNATYWMTDKSKIYMLCPNAPYANKNWVVGLEALGRWSYAGGAWKRDIVGIVSQENDDATKDAMNYYFGTTEGYVANARESTFYVFPDITDDKYASMSEKAVDENGNSLGYSGYWKYDESKGWYDAGSQALNLDAESFVTSNNPGPAIKYAVYHLGRVFGADDKKVYVSEYNNYCGWAFDTADNANEANAWMSLTQAANQRDESITGMVKYRESVYVFTPHTMQEIRGSSNPFRVVGVFETGCIDYRSICVINDTLAFVSGDGIKLFNGNRLYSISDELDIDEFKSACATAYGDFLYVFCRDALEKKHFLVYDIKNGVWSRRKVPLQTISVDGVDVLVDADFISMTCTDEGAFGMTEDGSVYRIDTDDYNQDWFFETDLMLDRNIDIKHISKIQTLVELAPGAKMQIHILYDSEEFDKKKSLLVYEKTNNSDKPATFAARFLPRKTAAYGHKIRFSGKGFAKVCQLEVVTRDGGDLYETTV